MIQGDYIRGFNGIIESPLASPKSLREDAIRVAESGREVVGLSSRLLILQSCALIFWLFPHSSCRRLSFLKARIQSFNLQGITYGARWHFSRKIPHPTEREFTPADN